MQEHRNQMHLTIPPAVIFLPVLLLAVLVLLGVNIWQQYKTTLMNNQTEQLLLISKTLGQNMEVSLREYENTLNFLSRVEECDQGTEGFYKAFFNEQNSFCDLQVEDAEGVCLKTIQGLVLSDYIELAQPDDETSFWQCRGSDGTIYLAMKHQLQGGKVLSLILDEENYYKELISDIRVGTNGYIVIKSSDGKIIMHPSREQWGIDVIEGRKALFSELDYDSLSEMIDEQIADESGIYEYESYWWTDPNLPRVRKVSAHAHVKLGNDFWIVSAVVDYSDFYTPIESGFRGILMVFLGVLIVFIILAFLIGKLLLDRKRATSEIEYLRELNEMLEKLHRSEETLAHQQRLQVIGAMTGGIAHEFNNFLTPIMGHADLLMTEVPEDSDIYDSAQEIYEASEKAKELIRQISAMSRKNVETVYKCVPTKKMLQRTLKLMDTICPPQVHLKQDIQLEEECFLGNTTQIYQVLLNLCTNAIQAIGQREGTITFRGKCVEREVVVRQVASENVSGEWKQYIQIDVEDNGCGMDSTTLRHIFEPFFTTKKSGEGTGLGLSLADQIIRTHRGYICAESEAAKGTTFHIFLPVLEPYMETEQLQWGQSQELNLVVADDNVKILELLERRFDKLGIKIRTCTRREELRSLLREEVADVLAIDETLEDEDGIDFCMSIQEKYPDMLKIIMTNMVTREVVEAKRRHIIDDYVEKPVSDTTLLATIRNCKDKRLDAVP